MERQGFPDKLPLGISCSSVIIYTESCRSQPLLVWFIFHQTTAMNNTNMFVSSKREHENTPRIVNNKNQTREVANSSLGALKDDGNNLWSTWYTKPFWRRGPRHLSLWGPGLFRGPSPTPASSAPSLSAVVIKQSICLHQFLYCYRCIWSFTLAHINTNPFLFCHRHQWTKDKVYS